MASILLLGNDRDVETFAGILLDTHQVTRLGDGKGYATAGTEQFDLVIDLSEHLPERDQPIVYPVNAVVFASVLTTTATAATERAGARTVFGLSFMTGVSDTSPMLEISAPLGSSSEQATHASSLLAEATGREIELVEDRVALVSARILAMVINEAAFALMERVADAGDIDTAMKLGTNYPQGPLAWVDTIGARRIVSILEALYAEYGEERYRPAVLLKQHARASQPFHSLL